MKRIALPLVLFCFLVGMLLEFTGCGDSPSSPDPPPPTPTTTTTTAPVFNPGVTFSWNDTRGILVFAGTQAREGEIISLDGRLRGMGWPTPFYHVCSEVARWESTPWADGPEPFSEENLENLERFLRVTAEIGSQVMLDVFCTVRDAPNWMTGNQTWVINGRQRTGNRGEIYAELIGSMLEPYDHVVVHVANEIWHPASWFRGSTSRIRAHRDAIRAGGFRGEIGTDDNSSGARDVIYNDAFRGLGFWPDFHPWREIDGRDSVPNREDLRKMVRRNSWGRVVISEPIAYSETRGGGCCTDNRNLVTQYMRDAEAEGIVWTYHSTDGLLWPQQSFGWLPQ